MASTITAFTSFSPLTTIYSAQVNTNFSNFRGDLIPINETTATASDASHSLGLSSHRWTNLHLSADANVGGNANITGNANVGTAVFLGTANTAGSWKIVVGATNTALLFQRYSTTTYITKGEWGTS